MKPEKDFVGKLRYDTGDEWFCRTLCGQYSAKFVRMEKLAENVACFHGRVYSSKITFTPPVTNPPDARYVEFDIKEKAEFLVIIHEYLKAFGTKH